MGGSIKKTGIYEEIMGYLKTAGKTVVEFSGIRSNPTYAKVLEGAALAKKEKVDLILAVGGGSVMDCSKAISLGAVYDGDLWDAYWAHAGKIETKPIPLGIVLTVSGTGSETNGGSVITNESLKVKTGRDYPELNAQFAILNPKYTETVPKFQFISGAFDSLSHMMEIYFSEPNDNNVSDVMNEALMRSAVDNIRAILVDPHDEGARSNLCMACDYGGKPDPQTGKEDGLPVPHPGTQPGRLYLLQPRRWSCRTASRLLPSYRKGWDQKFARFAEKVFDIDPSEGDELTRAQKASRP